MQYFLLAGALLLLYVSALYTEGQRLPTTHQASFSSIDVEAESTLR